MTQVYVPDRLRRLIGMRDPTTNCWGATEWVFSGFAPDLVAAQFDDEHEQWLQAHTTPVPDGEPPQWGDVLVLRNPEVGFQLEHSAVVVGDGQCFHKRGYGGPFEVVSIERAVKIYTAYFGVDMQVEFRRPHAIPMEVAA